MDLRVNVSFLESSRLYVAHIPGIPESIVFLRDNDDDKIKKSIKEKLKKDDRFKDAEIFINGG